MVFNNCDKNLINYESAMIRFFNDAQLYEQAVEMFLNSKLLDSLKENYIKKDYEKMFQCAHELKGACGNLSFVALYSSASELTETVRNGLKDEKEFEKAYNICIENYNKIITYLNSLK